jgi:hypothetical protein
LNYFYYKSNIIRVVCIDIDTSMPVIIRENELIHWNHMCDRDVCQTPDMPSIRGVSVTPIVCVHMEQKKIWSLYIFTFAFLLIIVTYWNDSGSINQQQWAIPQPEPHQKQEQLPHNLRNLHPSAEEEFSKENVKNYVSKF